MRFWPEAALNRLKLWIIYDFHHISVAFHCLHSAQSAYLLQKLRFQSSEATPLLIIGGVMTISLRKGLQIGTTERLKKHRAGCVWKYSSAV